MTFQQLRANAQIYILHKEAITRMETGIITKVSVPYPKAGQPVVFGQPQEMVVDVTVRAGDQSLEIPRLAANGDFADRGTMIISCSREAVNAEVEGRKQLSVDALNNIDAYADGHRANITACDEILKTVNPERAEQQRRNEEYNRLQKDVADLTQGVASIAQSVAHLASIVEKSTKKTEK